jgi:hypothetical protein
MRLAYRESADFEMETRRRVPRRTVSIRHVFVGSKAPWFEITDDLPQYRRDGGVAARGTGAAERSPAPTR